MEKFKYLLYARVLYTYKVCELESLNNLVIVSLIRQIFVINILYYNVEKYLDRHLPVYFP